MDAWRVVVVRWPQTCPGMGLALQECSDMWGPGGVAVPALVGTGDTWAGVEWREYLAVEPTLHPPVCLALSSSR